MIDKVDLGVQVNNMKIICTEKEQEALIRVFNNIETCWDCMFNEKCKNYMYCDEVIKGEIEWEIIPEKE